MKKTMFLAMLTALTAVSTSCTKDDTLDINTNSSSSDTSSADNNNSGSSSGSTNATTGELASFTVAIDKSTAEPSSSVAAYYPEEEDDPTANSFTTQVSIDMSNPTARTESGVTITVSGGHVKADHGDTKDICYYVTGTTTNGSLTIVGEKKYEVILNGVDITNPDSAALNLLSKKRAFLMMADGSTNKLTDGTTSKNDHKGALYAKGKLLINGKGALDVYGNYNNAIHSADYIVFSRGTNVYAKSTANNGIKTNDGIFINGGILNVEVSAAAAKGINSESDVIVNGGRTTVITTGGGAWDTDEQEAKGAAGIKSDTNVTVNGGELWLKSTGAGGKGISSDGAVYFYGGNTYIITEGSQYKSNNDTASPKGIKADGDIDINGGTIWVRTTGTNGEGVESKATLNITGGEVACYTYDDAINSAGDMTISGGYVYAQSRTNDGVDANGNCYIKGGVVFAISAGGAEVAIDANTEGGKKLYVQGGTIVALGGLEQGSQLTQSCYQTSWKASTWYSLTSGSDIFAFQTPASGATGMVVSTASTPTLTESVTVAGGTTHFGGLSSWGASISGGSSVSLSNYSGGSMGGGGMPGGRW